MRRLSSLSVAIPAYNEVDVLPALIDRLSTVLNEIPIRAIQVLIVDDGSNDGTAELLRSVVKTDARFQLVVLSRNFGHQAAVSAALDRARGEATVVMDADLQDDPRFIPSMIERYEQGYDVVYAVRRTREEPLWLRVAYRVFYRIIARLSSVVLPLDAGDFGLMSRRVVETIRRAPERQRYLRGLRAWAGFRQCGLEIDRGDRHAGKSKYSTPSLVRLALDGIFAFSTIPLRLATIFGGLAVAVAGVWALYVLYAKLFLDQAPQGFSSVIITIVFLSGTNLFFLGVIGEYVGRTYEESKGRPLYVVDEVVGEAEIPSPGADGN